MEDAGLRQGPGCLLHAQGAGGRRGGRGTGSSLRLEAGNTGTAQAPCESDSETRAGGRAESSFQETEQALWAQEDNHEIGGADLQPATPASGRTDSPDAPQSTRPCSEQRKREAWGPRPRPAHKVKRERGSGSTYQLPPNVSASLKLTTPTRF